MLVTQDKEYNMNTVDNPKNHFLCEFIMNTVLIF